MIVNRNDDTIDMFAHIGKRIICKDVQFEPCRIWQTRCYRLRLIRRPAGDQQPHCRVSFCKQFRDLSPDYARATSD